LLLLTSPNLRGDDVSELQRLLLRIGFDCDRIDGIFGPDTARALIAFQRNYGLPPDGVCGRDVITALEVLGRQSGSGPGVAVVREIAAMTGNDRQMAELRIVLGQFGGMSGLARQVAQTIRHHGATVIALDEPDPSAQAAMANRFAASVYVGFIPHNDARCSVAYYSVPGFDSPTGRSLAHYLCAEFAGACNLAVESTGIRHPVLRETKMTAVLCSLGPIATILDRTPELTASIDAALSQWARRPVDDRFDSSGGPPERSR
jgi:N-acetylmuramoyl-L-alanine amidase